MKLSMNIYCSKNRTLLVTAVVALTATNVSSFAPISSNSNSNNNVNIVGNIVGKLSVPTTRTEKIGISQLFSSTKDDTSQKIENVASAQAQKDQNNNNNNATPFFAEPMETVKSSLPLSPDSSANGSSVNNNNNGAMAVETTSSKDTSPTSEVINDTPLQSLLWKGSVVVLCGLWASNFPVAKMVMAQDGVDSALYAVTRFGLAAAALLPGTIAAVRRGAINLETAKGAAICGSWVAFGYLGQTLGLLTTTASRSCVICSMHCVFVGIVAEYWRTQQAKENSVFENVQDDDSTKFNIQRLIPAAIAVLGVAIVELQGAAGGPTIGDALSFAQPIGFGLGYLTLEKLMKQQPEAALPVSFIKLAVVALASFGFFELSPLILGTVDSMADFSFRLPDVGAVIASPVALSGILYTGLITTALALWVESIAFKRVPATDASIILTTEPLFAAAAGALYLGETFGISDYVGATLIIGACIAAVLMEEEGVDEECDPHNAEECEGEPPRVWPFRE